MRIAVFFVYLCFHLLGGNHLHADTHHSSIINSSTSNFAKNEQVKLIITDQSNTIIEETDVDVEEEYFSGDDVKDGGSNKVFTGKFSLSDGWCLKHSRLFSLKYYSKRFKIFTPFNGHSNPIYIRLRVLRI